MSTAALQSTAIVSAAMLNSGQTPAIQIYNDPPSAGSPRKQLVFKQHQQHQQQQRQHDFGHQSKLHKSRSALRDLSNMAANSNNATATLSTKLTPMLGKLDLIQPKQQQQQQQADGDRNRSLPPTSQPSLENHKLTAHFSQKEYLPEIMQHLLDLESARRPSSNYLAKQREITMQHRHRLVDWMSRLCHRLKYDQETLHLAVNYLDRFLTKKNVPVYRMKLVGTACLFVAGKFEETSPSTAEDYLLAMTGLDGSIGDGGRGDASGVPMGDLLSMESCLIDTLQFDLSTATANVFACHLMDSSLPAVDSFDRLRFKSLVNYLTELSLLDYGLLAYKPSQIALSSVVIAWHTLGYEQIWSPRLGKLCGCRSAADIRHCVRVLYTLFECSPTLGQSIRRKYLRSEHCSVAVLRLPQSPPVLSFYSLPCADFDDDCDYEYL